LRAIICFGLLIIACTQPTETVAATSQDLAVFQAVIRQHMPSEAHPRVDVTPPNPWLIVFDRTYRLCRQDADMWCMPKATIEELETWVTQRRDDVVLIREFVSRNQAAFTVSNPDPIATVVVPADSLEALGQSDEFWPIFRTRYPGTRGWLRFSAPSYGDSGSAIVYVTYGCGGLCGEGWLIRLSRVGTDWRMVGSHSVWIS
jgi:hypothetical protein